MIDIRPAVLNQALFLAVKHGHDKTASELLHAGAEVNARTTSVKNGKVAVSRITPLMVGVVSASEDSLELVQILIEAGADINARNSQGNTALHYAVKSDNYEMVTKLLAQEGIDVNKQNNNGDTALHLAAQITRDSNCYYTLLQHKDINADIENDKGEQARDLCIHEIRRDLGEAFLAKAQKERAPKDQELAAAGPEEETDSYTKNEGTITTIVGNLANSSAINITDGAHISDNANYPTLGSQKHRF